MGNCKLQSTYYEKPSLVAPCFPFWIFMRTFAKMGFFFISIFYVTMICCASVKKSRTVNLVFPGRPIWNRTAIYKPKKFGTLLFFLLVGSNGLTVMMYFTFLLVILVSAASAAEDTSPVKIKMLTSKPEVYKGEVITVQCLVTNHVADWDEITVEINRSVFNRWESKKKRLHLRTNSL